MEQSPVLDFRARRAFNQDIFLLSHADAFFAYHQIHKNFDLIGLPLSREYDPQGRGHVGLVPFLLLLQRQAMSALWAMTGHQSFEAWVLLRPGIEAALIIGKWLDDPAFATLWRDRDTRADEYRRQYQGKALASRSLPRSDEIQAALKRINDEFVHANDRYYDRHTSLTPADPDNYFLAVQYFDVDTTLFRAHVLAFLHLLLAIQTSLSSAVANLFPSIVAPQVGLAAFEAQFRAEARDLAKAQPAAVRVLQELGLWHTREVA